MTIPARGIYRRIKDGLIVKVTVADERYVTLGPRSSGTSWNVLTSNFWNIYERMPKE